MEAFSLASYQLETRHHEVLEFTYNEHIYLHQHSLFIKTYDTCFDPTLGHPQACGRLSHWWCVYIGIPICLKLKH